NATTCNHAGMIDPVVEYDHSQGNSVTGGFVYRGTSVPALVGEFIFGDYGSGRIWAVTHDPTTGAPSMAPLVETGLNIAAFGQTLDGEIYALGISDGSIQRLVSPGPTTPSTFPQNLSQTGCFDPADPRKPVAALVPYAVNAALWSDGAAKDRAFALPDG